jgi:hypothetical protein
MSGESHENGVSKEELNEDNKLPEDEVDADDEEWDGIAQGIEDGQPSEHDTSDDDDEIEEVPKEAPKSASSWVFTTFKYISF